MKEIWVSKYRSFCVCPNFILNLHTICILKVVLFFPGATIGQIVATPSVSRLPLKSPCNAKCQCSLNKFSPVCGSDSVTYFDACHAGCTVKLPNKVRQVLFSCCLVRLTLLRDPHAQIRYAHIHIHSHIQLH